MIKPLLQPTRHILIITPVEDMAVILRFSLKQINNLYISVVSSITQGVQVAMANHPDLLLVDTDTLEEHQLFTLRASPVLQPVPIICLTSRVRLNDHYQGERLGITQILEKPFDPDDLVKQVDANLGGSPFSISITSKLNKPSLTSNHRDGQHSDNQRTTVLQGANTITPCNVSL